MDEIVSYFDTRTSKCAESCNFPAKCIGRPSFDSTAGFETPELNWRQQLGARATSPQRGRAGRKPAPQYVVCEKCG